MHLFKIDYYNKLSGRLREAMNFLSIILSLHLLASRVFCKQDNQLSSATKDQCSLRGKHGSTLAAFEEFAWHKRTPSTPNNFHLPQPWT